VLDSRDSFYRLKELYDRGGELHQCSDRGLEQHRCLQDHEQCQRGNSLMANSPSDFVIYWQFGAFLLWLRLQESRKCRSERTAGTFPAVPN